MQVALVFVGGGIGSALRYLIGILFRSSGAALPLATFISNITACIIFALFVAVTNQRTFAGGDLKIFMLTGICGGLSTFSTFGYETFLLIQQGSYFWAIANVLISVLLSLLIFNFIK